MKKVLLAAVVLGGSMAFMSCKKEYTCCYYDSDGTKLADGIYGCATAKMKKSEMEDLESEMNTVAALWGGSAKCEK